MNPDARRARLHQLAVEHGIYNPSPVVVPSIHPSPATQNDKLVAEELLRRRRSTDPDRGSQGIKKAFSKKTWEPKEVFDALDAHVSSGGAPGVADALINILQVHGGNINVSNVKNRMSLLTRKKSIESMERSRVLQKAIQNRQPDMVAMLVQYADPVTINDALPFAIRYGDPIMLQMLLQRGADTADGRDSQDAFRQMCIAGGQADLVGLILQSGGRPPSIWLSMSLVDATRNGCLETVLRLSRSTASSDYNNADALKTAITQGRVDIALALLTGAKPPQPGTQGLMESFVQLSCHANIGPNEKMMLTEALLCAGASGEVVANALLQACQSEFHDMIDLLIKYGASVEHQDAAALRAAIANNRANLVQLLLSEQAALSPLYASECIHLVPKSITPETRHAFLTLLLKKGAGGSALHDALITAVEACDMQTIDLLLTSQFPGGRAISNGDVGAGRGVVYERHEVASLDHKNGLALSIAVRTNHLQIVKRLLAGKPSSATLDLVFPQVSALPSADRYHMTEQFLAAGLSGKVISATLEQAIEEQPPRRDERLISLLLRYNADVNVNDGTGILSAITIRDLALLQTLLQNRPAQHTIAAAVQRAMELDDKRLRYEMIRALINAGAGREGTEVSVALLGLMRIKPVDGHLAALLIEYGRADANFENGALIIEGRLASLEFPISQLTTNSCQGPRSRHLQSRPPAWKANSVQPATGFRGHLRTAVDTSKGRQGRGDTTAVANKRSARPFPPQRSASGSRDAA